MVRVEGYNPNIQKCKWLGVGVIGPRLKLDKYIEKSKISISTHHETWNVNIIDKSLHTNDCQYYT